MWLSHDLGGSLCFNEMPAEPVWLERRVSKREESTLSDIDGAPWSILVGWAAVSILNDRLQTTIEAEFGGV